MRKPAYKKCRAEVDGVSASVMRNRLLAKPRSFNKLFSVLRDYSGKITVGDLVKFILCRVAPD
jgi:hypothetical protein